MIAPNDTIENLLAAAGRDLRHRTDATVHARPITVSVPPVRPRGAALTIALTGTAAVALATTATLRPALPGVAVDPVPGPSDPTATSVPWGEPPVPVPPPMACDVMVEITGDMGPPSAAMIEAGRASGIVYPASPQDAVRELADDWHDPVSRDAYLALVEDIEHGRATVEGHDIDEGHFAPEERTEPVRYVRYSGGGASVGMYNVAGAWVVGSYGAHITCRPTDLAPGDERLAQVVRIQADPPTVAPGEQVRLRFPDHATRGDLFVLYRWDEHYQSYERDRWLISGRGGDEPGWLQVPPVALWDGAPPQRPPVSIADEGPDVVAMPETAVPGDYLVCLVERGTDEAVCGVLRVVAED